MSSTPTLSVRLLLRHTAIGTEVISCLNDEAIDRQAELRRWVELGFAAERAGFRVDGTTLCFAGSPFLAPSTTGLVHSSTMTGSFPSAGPVVQHVMSTGPAIVSGMPGTSEPPLKDSGASSSRASAPISGLLGNLRGLTTGT